MVVVVVVTPLPCPWANGLWLFNVVFIKVWWIHVKKKKPDMFRHYFVGIPELFLFFSFSERARDRGTNTIGSRLNRMEDKVSPCVFKHGGKVTFILKWLVLEILEILPSLTKCFQKASQILEIKNLENIVTLIHSPLMRTIKRFSEAYVSITQAWLHAV